MCGLFGVVSTSELNSEKEKLLESLRLLDSRGPDSFGYFSTGNVFIGHTRLSILDLSVNASQPMIDEKSGVVLSVNGEIYNFKNLREELSDKYNFNSGSDSEVLLYGYIEWGIEGLSEKIDGMYAISIYDPRLDTVFLVRDRAGIKPLFLSVIDKKVIWSSEIKSIENYLTRKTVDNTALYDFLTYLYIPTPKTLYKEIKKIFPATITAINLKTLSVNESKYWTLDVSTEVTDCSSSKIRLKQLIQESVTEQMVSDVPLGFFLSGGVDSSVIAACIGKEKIGKTAYTVAIEGQNGNESIDAKKVADHLGLSHKVNTLSELNTKEILDKLLDYFDEPFADTSLLPTYLVSKSVREDCTVALSGDGADELFGGYSWYDEFSRSFQLQKYLPKLLQGYTSSLHRAVNKSFCSKILRKLETKFYLSGVELYATLLGGLRTAQKNKYKKALGISKNYNDYWYFEKYWKEELPIKTRLQYLDFHTYLLDDILPKVDRASMAVSLECRVPFLKKEIIEFAFSIPESIRFYGGEPKGILREVFKGDLPKSVFEKKKSGFSIPNSLVTDENMTKQEDILKRFIGKNEN